MPTRARAVCSACVPEPTPRNTSGVGQAELREEDIRHVRVVVLAGVDEHDARASGRARQAPRAPALPS